MAVQAAAKFSTFRLQPSLLPGGTAMRPTHLRRHHGCGLPWPSCYRTDRTMGFESLEALVARTIRMRDGPVFTDTNPPPRYRRIATGLRQRVFCKYSLRQSNIDAGRPQAARQDRSRFVNDAGPLHRISGQARAHPHVEPSMQVACLNQDGVLVGRLHGSLPS